MTDREQHRDYRRPKHAGKAPLYLVLSAFAAICVMAAFWLFR